MKSNVIEMQIQRQQTAADIKPKTPMNIILRYHGLRARAFWQGLVEAQLKRLQDLAAIASARVTLEWQHEVKPAFRVLALLEVPGPDFHAEAGGSRTGLPCRSERLHTSGCFIEGGEEPGATDAYAEEPAGGQAENQRAIRTAAGAYVTDPGRRQDLNRRIGNQPITTL